jgi:hypothetical protein
MSTLCAWKSPVSVLFLGKWLDHTYVTCNDPPKTWNCWGGNQGGELIGCIESSSSIAECLSKPFDPIFLTDTAEIIYGVTGVCHQTANRILYPNLTVEGAGGYSLSWALFNTYGQCHPWPPWFAQLIASGIRWYYKHRDCGVDALVINDQIDDKAKLYSREIISLHSSWDKLDASSETEKLKIVFDKEQELTMNYFFGNDSEFIPEVIKIRLASIEEKAEWDKQLLSADITHVNHAKEVNDICGNLARQISDVVGIDEFKKIFDFSPPKGSINIVVPEIAATLDKKKSL